MDGHILLLFFFFFFEILSWLSVAILNFEGRV